MKTFRNLVIVGTSHIAQQSVEEVKRVILETSPGVVALELDRTRFLSLMSEKKRKIRLSDLPKVGLKGYLFAMVGAYIQKKLGQIVKMEPGAEMRAAIKLARKEKIKLALIDQPIEITLKRFSQEITWKERFRLVGDIFRSLVFKKKELKKYGLENFDLTKVPEEKLVQKLITKLKERYPSIHKVLVKERNEVIAKNLVKLIKLNEEIKIVAVVGAGHEKELVGLIKRGLLEKELIKNNNL